MKEYVPQYPNPDDDGRPAWEKKLRPLFSAAEDVDGEGARPSSLIRAHEMPDPGRGYALMLMREVSITNERTVRELGPFPPGGLPMRKKTKPKVSCGDLQENMVPEAPIIEEDNGMKLKEAVAAAVLTLGTAACNSATPVADSTTTNNAINVTAHSAAHSDQVEKEKQDASPLGNLLNAFAMPNEVVWSAFDAIPGVEWNDMKKEKNFESDDKDASYFRSGRLLLAGFGVAGMPNGKVGVDFGLVQGNEGEAGVTISGDTDHVHSISLTKIYPSENYQEILHKQLLASDLVTLIAERCVLNEYGKKGNADKNRFYEIRLPSGLVYAEVSVSEDDAGTASASALGSTLFTFYRNKPMQRISKMGCHQI